ncbi:uncharacterized protein MYCFIDRAFT_26280 [Pseudocercospora fijiensis CIRAD86]|uniref:N-acetyltransferase domain-containing protein n=1 Tax=Pseudocercospora fijiensis (strain CIRAD86) TaxID=383855 RepID=N1QBI9_PSEFD|nr:uncharacterized protein MYCFIDRAFT_26280 [Pseudocercospora fijiensis CIRAD86]EME89491.1 hypothetical protein MYCFIDRAFT_26280 [Pseudocercospora fijiensis CIRAD86]
MTTSKIIVAPAEDADMSRIFDITTLAFARNEPVWDAMWPNHWTEEGKRQGVERMLKIKNTDPCTTYIKAVDSETGEILGMAKWLVFNEKLPASRTFEGGTGDYWPDEEEARYAKTMAEIFVRERNAYIESTKGKIVSLDILTVDPAHQRKQVGDALVKWGLAKADELGYDAIVESSVYGRRLYEKNGYVWQKDVTIQVPGYEGKRPAGGFAWMIRPKRTTA